MKNKSTEEEKFEELKKLLPEKVTTDGRFGFMYFNSDKILAFIKENYIPKSKLLEIVGEDKDADKELHSGNFRHIDDEVEGYNTAKAEIRANIEKL